MVFLDKLQYQSSIAWIYSGVTALGDLAITVSLSFKIMSEEVLLGQSKKYGSNVSTLP